MTTIKLPSAVGIDTLENFIAICPKIQQAVTDQQKVELDLSPCSRFQTDLCAVLGAVLFDPSKDEYCGNTIACDSDVYSSLDNNGFIQSINDSKYTVSKTDIADNIIPYQRFSTASEHRNVFKEYLDNYFWSHCPDLSMELKKNIIQALFEILENIEMHSGQHVAFVCGQSDSKSLELTIANCGRTIIENVRDELKESNYSSQDAMAWALERGNTTRAISNSTTSGGLGLPIIMDFIELNEGDFYLHSGDITYGRIYSMENSKPSMHKRNAKLSGTFISLSINMNDDAKYKMLEESEEDEDSDIMFDPN